MTSKGDHRLYYFLLAVALIAVAGLAYDLSRQPNPVGDSFTADITNCITRNSYGEGYVNTVGLTVCLDEHGITLARSTPTAVVTR